MNATDPDTGDTLTYTLDGIDAANFGIIGTSGQLQTKVGEKYDYETQTSYLVTVRVEDGSGGSDTIDVTLDVTDRNEAPLPPTITDVSATSGSTTSLDVSWTAPNNTGRPEITSYDLQYREGTSGNFTNGPQDVAPTSRAIGSLMFGTMYQVQVRATNAEGDGDWSQSEEGTTTGLVSNTHLTPSSSTSDRFQAQSFETGAAAGGYTVSEVDIRFANVSGKSTNVKIREDDGGEPGTLVATLTNPDTLTANSLNTFTASPSITLERSTTYWITVNEGISSNRASLGNVESDDQTGETGWSIGDGRLWRSSEISPWTTRTYSLLIAIRGTSVGLYADATLSDLTLEDGDGNAVTLRPTFDSATRLYTAAVANSVDEITVFPTVNDSRATYEIQDDSGTALTDADTNATGFQVDLAEGDNVIKVEVTAEDPSTMLTYTVTVQPLPHNTLVSNTHLSSGFGGGSDSVQAQSFKTGAADSYTVSEVDVYFVDVSGKSTSVSIRENDAGEPGALVATLTNPDTLTANSPNTFTASPGVTLDASTTYWITVNEEIASNRASLGNVLANDQVGATGWSIGDTRLNRIVGTWSDSPYSLLIAIRSTARGTVGSCDGIWCATLTVRDLGSSDRGCGNVSSGNECTTYLSDYEFTHAMTDYSVTAARVQSGGQLQLWLNNDITSDSESLVLHVGSETFAFEDADTKEARNRKWNGSGLSWTTGDPIELKLTEGGTNTDATGQPEISGAAQVGKTLTAEQGDIDDDDGLPSGTFPAGYTFEWVSVDALNVETSVGSSSSYTVSSTDVGSTIRVEVSFTDGAGNDETVISDPVGPVVAAARDSCPAGNDWEATLTMGYSSVESPGVRVQQFGFNLSSNFGDLDPTTIPHGPTSYTVTRIFRVQ